jgi:hypothetical protein
MSYYVVRQKIDKSGGNEKVRYHGVPVASEQVGVDELAKYICGAVIALRGFYSTA